MRLFLDTMQKKKRKRKKQRIRITYSAAKLVMQMTKLFHVYSLITRVCQQQKKNCSKFFLATVEQKLFQVNFRNLLKHALVSWKQYERINNLWVGFCTWKCKALFTNSWRICIKLRKFWPSLFDWSRRKVTFYRKYVENM